MHRYLNTHSNHNHGNGECLPDLLHHNNTSVHRNRLHELERQSKMVDVAVVESEQRKNKYLRDSYIAYLVESRPFGGSLDQKQSVWRRYREFEILRYYLSTAYPYVVMPPLPEKRTNVTRFRFAWNKFDPDFVERRKDRLSHFLTKLAGHPAISEDEAFQGFLHADNEVWMEVAANHWKEKLSSTLQAVVQTFSIGAAPPPPEESGRDNRMMRIKLYAQSLDHNIANVVKVHGRISRRNLSIMKHHLEYGKVFRLWLSLEKNKEGIGNRLSDLLDSLSDQTTTFIYEDQSHFIGILKEYSLYVGSLAAVVWNQQTFKHKLSQDEKRLISMKKEREKLKEDLTILEQAEYSPVSASNSLRNSVRSKILGPRSVEEKQEKILALDKDIKKNDCGPACNARKTKVFEEKTLEEFERFEVKKFEDVHEMVVLYVKNQVKLNETALTQWKLMREYFVNL